jgi:succinate dehydrogenase hydrophobic anchor subunit
MIGFSTLLFIIGLIVAGYGVSLLNKDTTQKNKAKFYILIGLITALCPFIFALFYVLLRYNFSRNSH